MVFILLLLFSKAKLNQCIFSFSDDEVEHIDNYIVLYWMVLVHINLRQYDLWIRYISKLKLNLLACNAELSQNLTYLEALWYKLMDNFQAADKWYKKVCEILHRLEKAQVVKYTLGLLLIPTFEERYQVENFVENFSDILRLYTFNEVKHEGITQYFDFKHNLWQLEYIKKIVDYLIQLPFFHRFKQNELKLMLSVMTLKIAHKNDVLFTNQKYVYIIIHGDVVLKSHETGAFPFKLMAWYRQGGIIGSEYECVSNRYANCFWFLSWFYILDLKIGQ